MKNPEQLFPHTLNLKQNIPFLVIFCFAMGALETIVVIYIRMLYYPEGFYFPLKLLNSKIYGIELLRELATLVMLGSISYLASKKFYVRLAYFLLTFAIWDISYYLWLKVLINWPETFLDWDILFLVPVAWVGPVLAPIICSLVMLVISSLILFLENKGISVNFKTYEWLIILSGSTVIFSTFIYDYSALIIRGGFLDQISTLSTNARFEQMVMHYVPDHYQWIWFGLGITMILCAIGLFVRRYMVNKS